MSKYETCDVQSPTEVIAQLRASLASQKELADAAKLSHVAAFADRAALIDSLAAERTAHAETRKALASVETRLKLRRSERDWLEAKYAAHAKHRRVDAKRASSYGWSDFYPVDLAIEAFINGTSYLELTHAAKYVPSLDGLMRKLWNARQALGAGDPPLPPASES